MKAGTTLLHTILSRSPHVFLPHQKEPNFFIGKGEDYFFVPSNKSGFMGIHSESQYNGLFKGAPSSSLTGEASVTYLVDPDSPRLIKSALPDCKLIFVLRNPAERAYSAYQACRSWGVEENPVFWDVIEEELAGKRDNWWYAFRYIYYGRYHQHLKRYYDIFDPRQILVIDFQKLVQSPEETVLKISDFLGIPSIFTGESIERVHETKTPLNPLIARLKLLLTDNSPFKEYIKKRMSPNVRARIKYSMLNIISKAPAKRPERINVDDMKKLNEIFCNESEDVSALTGVQFSWVRSSANFAPESSGDGKNNQK